MNFQPLPCCLTVKTTQLALHMIEVHSSFSQWIEKKEIDNTHFYEYYEKCKKKLVTPTTLLNVISSTVKDLQMQSFELLSILPFLNANDSIIIYVKSQLQESILLKQIQKVLNQSDYFSTVSFEKYNEMTYLSTKTSLFNINIIESNETNNIIIDKLNETHKYLLDHDEYVPIVFLFEKYLHFKNKDSIHLIQYIDILHDFIFHYLQTDEFHSQLKSNQIPYLQLQDMIMKYTTQCSFTHLSIVSESFPKELFADKIHQTNESNVIACSALPGYLSVVDFQLWLKPFNAVEFLLYQPSFFNAITQKCGVIFIKFNSQEDAMKLLEKPESIHARYASYFYPSIFDHPPSGCVHCTLENIEWLEENEINIIQ